MSSSCTYVLSGKPAPPSPTYTRPYRKQVPLAVDAGACRRVRGPHEAAGRAHGPAPKEGPGLREHHRAAHADCAGAPRVHVPHPVRACVSNEDLGSLGAVKLTASFLCIHIRMYVQRQPYAVPRHLRTAGQLLHLRLQVGREGAVPSIHPRQKEEVTHY